MLDREKVVAVLKHRFPGAGEEQVAAATNAIVGLADEWVEVPAALAGRDSRPPLPCGTFCYLAQAAEAGASFRVFQRMEDGNHET
jgi:hypothetical protein